MYHIRSRRAAHCSRSASGTAPAPYATHRPTIEQPAAIVVFAARRAASAQGDLPVALLLPDPAAANPDHDSTLKFGVATSGWCISHMPQGGRSTGVDHVLGDWWLNAPELAHTAGAIPVRRASPYPRHRSAPAQLTPAGPSRPQPGRVRGSCRPAAPSCPRLRGACRTRCVRGCRPARRAGQDPRSQP